MDTTASLDAPCAPDELFAWIDDLQRYPEWLTIVVTASPTAAGAGEEAAWLVDLRGRLGPFARSKRLRMVRVDCDAPRHVRFERAETDGRRHSPWTLDATVEPLEGGCRLTMTLHYGGGLWAPVLERMLRDEIEQGRARLLALVAA